MKIIILFIILLLPTFWYSWKKLKLTNFRNAIINEDCQYDTPEKIRDEWNKIK